MRARSGRGFRRGPAVALDEHARDGKAKAHAPIFLLLVLADMPPLDERLEDPGKLLGAHTDSGVADAYLYKSVPNP